MNEIILTNLPTETLAAMAAEKAELVEQHGRKTVQAAIDCGRYLIEIKSRLKHGEWLPWLDNNFVQSQEHASRYMRIATNYARVPNLEEATTLREALRMIGEADEATGTKRTRKPTETSAAPPALPEVEVIDTRPPKSAAQPQPARAMFDEDDLPPEEPAPLPKTNTHHTPATAQKIDRGPEITPADYLDDSTGMPLLEVVIAQHTTQEVVEALVAGLEGTQAKRVAAILRAAAEELDPQPVVIHEQPEATKRGRPAKHPTADQLMEAAETFRVKWSGQLMTQVCKWAEYKQSLSGNAKVRSLASWDAMLTRIDNVQKMRGPGTVCEMLNKAIANGWQGWEHDSGSNGKPTVASTRIDSGEDYSDLEYRTA